MHVRLKTRSEVALHVDLFRASIQLYECVFEARLDSLFEIVLDSHRIGAEDDQQRLVDCHALIHH